MKKVLLFIFLSGIAIAGDTDHFTRYFRNSTFRFDFYHTGTKGEERISLGKMIEEGEWPGSLTHLVDTLNLGEYIFKVVDLSTNDVLYSRGYSTMFNEWQSTDEAMEGTVRTFQESIRFPFPRRKFQLTISRRNKQMLFQEIFSVRIDPESSEIRRGKNDKTYPSFDVMINGDPHTKVDVLILPDGYTEDEMKKFRSDAKHFSEVLFSTEPFKSQSSKFNVRAIEAPSPQSGIDQPDKHQWKNNLFGSSYNTFGSTRYVLTEDNSMVRNVASSVPYDFLCLLVNTNRYGGGGIFQLYTTCYAIPETKETAWQPDYVFVHEFGHCFAGLGDEYYTSSVPYNDLLPKGIEPWEPNVASAISRKRLKWADMVLDSTPLPTPWNKDYYDSLVGTASKLQRDAKDYAERRKVLLDSQRSFLEKHEFRNLVGAFEGAGYSSSGLYRPAVDCRMFSLSLTDFDPVCTRAISRMIEFYSK